jgi:hypothetical protein
MAIATTRTDQLYGAIDNGAVTASNPNS